MTRLREWDCGTWDTAWDHNRITVRKRGDGFYEIVHVRFERTPEGLKEAESKYGIAPSLVKAREIGRQLWEKLSNAGKITNILRDKTLSEEIKLAHIRLVLLERSDEKLWEHINFVLPNLSERERNTLAMRYGLRKLNAQERKVFSYGPEKQPPLTFEDIGRIFGLSRERVRQIEKEALSKLLQLLELIQRVPPQPSAQLHRLDLEKSLGHPAREA